MCVWSLWPEFVQHQRRAQFSLTLSLSSAAWRNERISLQGLCATARSALQTTSGTLEYVLKPWANHGLKMTLASFLTSALVWVKWEQLCPLLDLSKLSPLTSLHWCATAEIRYGGFAFKETNATVPFVAITSHRRFLIIIHLPFTVSVPCLYNVKYGLFSYQPSWSNIFLLEEFIDLLFVLFDVWGKVSVIPLLAKQQVSHFEIRLPLRGKCHTFTIYSLFSSVASDDIRSEKEKKVHSQNESNHKWTSCVVCAITGLKNMDCVVQTFSSHKATFRINLKRQIINQLIVHQLKQ